MVGGVRYGYLSGIIKHLIDRVAKVKNVG